MPMPPILTPPGGEPVSPAELKAWLRVTHDAEDALLPDLIAAARQRVEVETGLVLDAASPAAQRLAVLALAADAYERRSDPDAPAPPGLGPAERWIGPFRPVRL